MCVCVCVCAVCLRVYLSILPMRKQWKTVFFSGDKHISCYVFLDMVGFRLDLGCPHLQPEINQNSKLELRQVFNLKTTLVGCRLDLGCPYYNLKSTKIQRWNCVRFSTLEQPWLDFR